MSMGLKDMSRRHDTANRQSIIQPLIVHQYVLSGVNILMSATMSVFQGRFATCQDEAAGNAHTRRCRLPFTSARSEEAGCSFWDMRQTEQYQVLSNALGLLMAMLLLSVYAQ